MALLLRFFPFSVRLPLEYFFNKSPVHKSSSQGHLVGNLAQDSGAGRGEEGKKALGIWICPIGEIQPLIHIV